MKNKVSIIVPAFNEEKTIRVILNKLLMVDFGCDKEILIIDDFSNDRTEEVVKKIMEKNKMIKLYKQKKNMGKGAAIRKGLEMAKGDIVTFQDADLEYEVNDLKKLVRIVLEGKSDVVYGSRFLGKGKLGQTKFYLGNKFLSLITNILYLTWITDMETCYKVFRSKILEDLRLRSNRFDIEPEITSKILKRRYKIVEFPIKYHPRKVEEGKKINWKDGFVALWTLVKYRFID